MNGVLNICPSNSSLDVSVRVRVRSLLGVRLTDNVGSGEIVNFDVQARMEEKERRSGWVNVDFALKVGTKPNIVKYEVEGEAILKGKDEEIKKMLEVDPETQIPFVFQRVYQHVFMSMYLLATLIDAPYPPSNLLYSNQQQISMEHVRASIAAAKGGNVQTETVTTPKEEQTLQPVPASTVSQEETAVQPTSSTETRKETTIPEEEQTPEV